MGQMGSGQFTAVIPTVRSCRPSPDGDISLQLCRDLCSVYWTVVCCVENSWGAIITHTNGYSLNPLAWAPKETLIWHEDSKQLLLKGCTCKHCIKGLQSASLQGHDVGGGNRGTSPRDLRPWTFPGTYHSTGEIYEMPVLPPTSVLTLPSSCLFSRSVHQTTNVLKNYNMNTKSTC